MWKALIAGTTILTIAGSTLASAQQPTAAERPHHAQLTADDIAAFTEARIVALKTALRLTPEREKNWPAVEQALRDISKERLARRAARGARHRRAARRCNRAAPRSRGCVGRARRDATAFGR